MIIFLSTNCYSSEKKTRWNIQKHSSNIKNIFFCMFEIKPKRMLVMDLLSSSDICANKFNSTNLNDRNVRRNVCCLIILCLHHYRCLSLSVSISPRFLHYFIHSKREKKKSLLPLNTWNIVVFFSTSVMCKVMPTITRKKKIWRGKN